MAVKQEMCRSGRHNMEVHGRPLKDGGRYCVPCKAERSQKQYWNSMFKKALKEVYGIG